MPADIVFVGVAVLTLAGAGLAVALRNVFYNALALILCLFGVACLFIYLDGEFLAIIEVIIYIGAITVAIIFAIMLSQPMLQTLREPRDWKKTGRSLLLGISLWIGLLKTLESASWPAAMTAGDYSPAAIGKALLTTAVLPFEVVSLVLLVAIIGALLVSGSRDKNT